MSAKPERITYRPPFDPEAYARSCDTRLADGESGDDRVSQLPTTPAIDLEECRAALARAASTASDAGPQKTTSGFRMRAVSAPVLVSSEDRPYLLMSRTDLEWFDFDDATTRVLLRIDGAATVEELVELTGIAFERLSAVIAELVTREVAALA